MPEKRFPIGDWTFSVRPLPKPDDLAGQPSRSPIGVFPGRVGHSDVRYRISDALALKARRYGKLDHPYLIAVLSSGTFAADDEDIAGALFGGWTLVLHETSDAQNPRSESTRADNGVWSATRNRGLSGVISARRLAPWSVNTESPRLWLNPWAERPLALDSTGSRRRGSRTRARFEPTLRWWVRQRFLDFPKAGRDLRNPSNECRVRRPRTVSGRQPSGGRSRSLSRAPNSVARLIRSSSRGLITPATNSLPSGAGANPLNSPEPAASSVHLRSGGAIRATPASSSSR